MAKKGLSAVPAARRAAKPAIDLCHPFLESSCAIDLSFPGGDPVDHLPRDIGMDLLDKAVKKHAPGGKTKVKYGLYDWLSDLWQEAQPAAVHDTKLYVQKRDSRLFDENSFYVVEGGSSFKDDVKTLDSWDKMKIIPRWNP